MTRHTYVTHTYKCTNHCRLMEVVDFDGRKSETPCHSTLSMCIISPSISVHPRSSVICVRSGEDVRTITIIWAPWHKRTQQWWPQACMLLATSPFLSTVYFLYWKMIHWPWYVHVMCDHCLSIVLLVVTACVISCLIRESSQINTRTERSAILLGSARSAI